MDTLTRMIELLAKATGLLKAVERCLVLIDQIIAKATEAGFGGTSAARAAA